MTTKPPSRAMTPQEPLQAPRLVPTDLVYQSRFERLLEWLSIAMVAFALHIYNRIYFCDGSTSPLVAHGQWGGTAIEYTCDCDDTDDALARDY